MTSQDERKLSCACTTKVMDEIAGEGVLKPYRYKSLEGEDSHTPRNSEDDQARDDERFTT